MRLVIALMSTNAAWRIDENLRGAERFIVTLISLGVGSFGTECGWGVTSFWGRAGG